MTADSYILYHVALIPRKHPADGEPIDCPLRLRSVKRPFALHVLLQYSTYLSVCLSAATILRSVSRAEIKHYLERKDYDT
jgi:hypothetical protein